MSDEKRYSAGDDDDSPKDLSHITPAYRRALWIVVALNAGYAIVEITASLIGRSEALKADALDFLGDGVITGMGLLAIKWSLVWRARRADPGILSGRAGRRRHRHGNLPRVCPE